MKGGWGFANQAADGVVEVVVRMALCSVRSAVRRLQVQRAWLRERIAASTAPVLIVASGSVLLGAPSRKNGPHDDPPYTSYCSGDDWDCYRPAQQNLIAELSRARGCVIVITGDYHSADIKRLHPDEAAPYATHYNSQVRVGLAPPLCCTCSTCGSRMCVTQARIAPCRTWQSRSIR